MCRAIAHPFLHNSSQENRLRRNLSLSVLSFEDGLKEKNFSTTIIHTVNATCSSSPTYSSFSCSSNIESNNSNNSMIISDYNLFKLSVLAHVNHFRPSSSRPSSSTTTTATTIFRTKRRSPSLTSSSIQCHVNMLMIIVLLLFVTIKSSFCAQYVAPGQCRWNHISSSSSPSQSSFDVSLHCDLNRIFSEGFNFRLIQADHTISLTINCDDSGTESKIESNSLIHLKNLRSLRIEGCKILRLSGDELKGLDSLRNLTIRSYSPEWSYSTLHLNQSSLSHLHKLELLDLSFNNISYLPADLFCPLTSLRVLNLTHNRITGFASLGVVDHTYGHLCSQELQQLDLSYNRIEYISKDSVANLKNLRSLQLQHNQISEIEEISLSALIRLQNIYLSNNKLVHLPSRLFQGLKLKELHLHNNLIYRLEPGLFTALADLLILDLSHNQISNDTISASTFADLVRLLILDLSNNKLEGIEKSFFQSLYSLQKLNLAYNSITYIEDAAFADLYNLHLLILDGNKLKTVGPATFKGAVVLSELSLNDNNIISIHNDALKNCSSLRKLHLNGNLLSDVPKAIGNVRELKTLSLARNSMITLANSGLSLRHLTSLDLSQNALYNLDRDFTKELPSLERLDLSGNQFQRLEPGIFDNSLNLREINLQDNELTDINGLFVNLYDLEILNVSRNHITWFEFAMIPEKLKTLDIHSNSIDKLSNYYKKVRNLTKLDFSHNNLTKIDAWLVPNSTEILQLNNNRITDIHPSTFASKTRMTLVDLRNNQLTGLNMNAFNLKPFTNLHNPLPTFFISSNPYFCDCNMDWLRPENRKNLGTYPIIADIDNVMCKLPFVRESSYLPLVKANSSNFLCKYKTHCFSLCHCCDFDACDCEMMCPDNCTCYHDQTWSTNVVDCAHREYINVPPRVPMDVTELYLDGNNLTALSSHTFIGRRNMRILHLNSSNIHSINNRTFIGLSVLEELNLSHNHLTSVFSYHFEALVNLTRLDLSYNRISIIENNTFSSLLHLKVLYLHHNSIRNFQLWSLTSNHRLHQVTLSSNPWSCNCEYIKHAIRWIDRRQSIISDLYSIECYHNESSKIRLITSESNISTSCTNYTESFQDNLSSSKLSQHSKVDSFLPIFVISGSLLIVFVLIVILIYRREMSVWFFSRFGVRLNRRSVSKREEEKLYDAFISYSKKDEAFVSQILAPEMEYGYPPYRMCLLYRDLPVASGYLSDAIVNAMEASQRTIIVLSDNFLKGEWCRYEFRSSHLEVLRTIRHRLIVISFGKICPKDLDPDMRFWLKSCTLLQWGEKFFWEKLRYALPDIAYTRKSDQGRDSTLPVNI